MKGVLATDKRGIRELGAEELVGWDEVTQGVVLHSFEHEVQNPAFIRPEERPYSDFNSYTATVASWRGDQAGLQSRHLHRLPKLLGLVPRYLHHLSGQANAGD